MNFSVTLLLSALLIIRGAVLSSTQDVDFRDQSPSAMYHNAVVNGKSFYRQHKEDLTRLAQRARNSLDDLIPKALATPPRPPINACTRDFLLTLSASYAGKFWAEKVLDSCAAKPSGFLAGNFLWFGDFDQCRSIKTVPVTSKISITPKYCRVAMAPVNMSIFTNPPTLLNDPIAFILGLCVPDSCNIDDLGFIVNPLVANLSLRISPRTSRCILDEHEIPYNGISIFTIFLFSLIGLCLLIGLAVDLTIRVQRWLEDRRVTYSDDEALLGSSSSSKEEEVAIKKEGSTTKYGATDNNNKDAEAPPTPPVEEQLYKRYERPPQGRRLELFIKLAMCFSPYENFKKIFTIPSNDAQSPTPNLTCINGIRVLSLFWVILGHTYYYPIFTYDNIIEAAQIEKRTSAMFLAAAYYAVDTFLFISGFLGYWSMSKVIRPQPVSRFFRSLPTIYFHRYVRLTPPLIAIVLIDLGLWAHLSSGPLYFQETDYNCATNWWTNILYLNNFVDVRHPCVGWSWYLAIDMQLFLLTPFVIYLFVWRPLYGWIASLGSLILQAIIAFSLTYQYNMPSTMTPPVTNFEAAMARDYSGFWEIIYVKFYVRLGPYVIGILCGHLATKHSFELTHRIFAKMRITILAWAIMFLLMLTLIYAQHDVLAGDVIESLFVSSLFNAFARTVWGLALGWLVLACIFKQGGIIGKILEWPGWAIPARLSYCGYLVHPLILLFYSTTLRRPHHMTDMTMIFLYFGVLFSALLLATVFSLAFESPIVGLLRFLMPGKVSSAKKPTQQQTE